VTLILAVALDDTIRQFAHGAWTQQAKAPPADPPAEGTSVGAAAGRPVGSPEA
jgi:hypothetical protein